MSFALSLPSDPPKQTRGRTTLRELGSRSTDAPAKHQRNRAPVEADALISCATRRAPDLKRGANRVSAIGDVRDGPNGRGDRSSCSADTHSADSHSTGTYYSRNIRMGGNRSTPSAGRR